MASVYELIDPKYLTNAVFALSGWFAAKIIKRQTDKVSKIPYTVSHDRIGITAADRTFGDVTVHWQNNQMDNLFISKLQLVNESSKDLKDINIKIYTGEGTLLLTHQTELLGTTQIIPLEEKFESFLRVEEGQAPSQSQFNRYNHNREFTIKVFNRGKIAVFTFLTTAIDLSNPAPSVWCEILHEGVEAKFHPNIPYIHGVPQKHALTFGILICALASIATLKLGLQEFSLTFFSIVLGLFAQFVGASIYKLLKSLKNLIVH